MRWGRDQGQICLIRSRPRLPTQFENRSAILKLQKCFPDLRCESLRFGGHAGKYCIWTAPVYEYTKASDKNGRELQESGAGMGMLRHDSSVSTCSYLRNGQSRCFYDPIFPSESSPTHTRRQKLPSRSDCRMPRNGCAGKARSFRRNSAGRTRKVSMGRESSSHRQVQHAGRQGTLTLKLGLCYW